MAKGDVIRREFSSYITRHMMGEFTLDTLERALCAAKIEVENAARSAGFEPHGEKIHVDFELDYGYDDYATNFDGIRLTGNYSRPMTDDEIQAREALKDKRKQAALKRKLVTELNRKKKLSDLEREQTRIAAEIANLREKLQGT